MYFCRRYLYNNQMAKKKHKRGKGCDNAHFIEVPKDYGAFADYMEYGPQYDTVDDCPVFPGDTETVARVTFKKLSSDTRKMLRSVMAELVIGYWNAYRQIPFGEVAKKLRQESIMEVYRMTSEYAKDSDELKHYLLECIVFTINKELKKDS